MEDRDYFDFLHQGWSKTTGAKDCFWMPEEDTEHYDGGPGTYDLFALNENQEKKFIASFEREEDISFTIAVHGSWPDLFRKLHEALDEADAKDLLADEYINRVGGLEMEIMELKEIIRDLEGSK